MSSNNREAAEEMAAAIRDIGKKYTRETRLAAWGGISSSQGKAEVKKLLITPTRSMSGVRQLSFKEWAMREATVQPLVKLNFMIHWHSKHEEDVQDIKGDLEKLLGSHWKVWTPKTPKYGMQLLCMFDLEPADTIEMVKDYHQQVSRGWGVSAESSKLSPNALDAMKCVRNCLSTIWSHHTLFHTTDQGFVSLTYINPGSTGGIFKYKFPESNSGGGNWDNDDDTDKPTPPPTNPKGEKAPWFVAV